MRCSPESVDTTSDNSLTFRAKAASSKAFCILETCHVASDVSTCRTCVQNAGEVLVVRLSKKSPKSRTKLP